MKISFIIPCYNGANTLLNGVESVVKQNIDDYEIIIINDGSTDNTHDVAQAIASKNSRVIVLDKPNGGVSSARNLGINKATGDYIMFLDADDEFDTAMWTEVKAYLQQGVELLIFGFDSEEDVNKVRVYNNKIKSDLIVDYLIGRVHIHICGMLTKREVIVDNAIRFDEGTYFSEDREFIVRVLLAACEYEYINKNLFHYKYREDSVMHVQQYTYRKSTSLDAMARVLDLIADNENRREAALVQLKLTILLHIRDYRKTHCDDSALKVKLLEYSMRYLTQETPLRWNKYYLYVWFFGWTWRFIFK